MARTNSRILDMINERYPTYHPLVAIADMAHRGNLPPALELDCHKTIAEYTEPKLRALDVRGQIDTPKVVVTLFDDEYSTVEDGNILNNPDVDAKITDAILLDNWADIVD